MRLFIFLSCVLCNLTLNAQQDLLLTSEGQRAFWFNPASIGTLNKYSISTIARKQWKGIDGSPNSLNLNAALKCIRIVKDENTIADGAVGLSYRYDEIGIQKLNRFNIQSNLQLNLTKSFLSIGVEVGVNQLQFNEDGLIPPTDEPDIIIVGGKETKFTMGVGINWYNRKLSLGFSTRHLLEEKYEKLNYKSARHYYFNGSYKFPITRTLSLKAVTSIRTELSSLSIGGMVYGIFIRHDLAIGLGYRNGKSILGGISVRFDKFYMGYFSEYHIHDLSAKDAFFSHEIRLAFELLDKRFLHYFNSVGLPSF